MTNYKLPDGRVVPVGDACKGKPTISYTIADGTVVEAKLAKNSILPGEARRIEKIIGKLREGNRLAADHGMALAINGQIRKARRLARAIVFVEGILELLEPLNAEVQTWPTGDRRCALIWPGPEESETLYRMALDNLSETMDHEDTIPRDGGD